MSAYICDNADCQVYPEQPIVVSQQGSRWTRARLCSLACLVEWAGRQGYTDRTRSIPPPCHCLRLGADRKFGHPWRPGPCPRGGPVPKAAGDELAVQEWDAETPE